MPSGQAHAASGLWLVRKSPLGHKINRLTRASVKLSATSGKRAGQRSGGSSAPRTRLLPRPAGRSSAARQLVRARSLKRCSCPWAGYGTPHAASLSNAQITVGVRAVREVHRAPRVCDVHTLQVPSRTVATAHQTAYCGCVRILCVSCAIRRVLRANPSPNSASCRWWFFWETRLPTVTPAASVMVRVRPAPGGR
jgi:hypothetical protein